MNLFIRNRRRRICEEKIDHLNKKITKVHNILNENAKGLFLSFIGVWSIPSASHKLMVSMFLITCFLWSVEKKKGGIKEPFPKSISEIESQIMSSNFSERTRESLLYQLNNTKKRITGISAFNNTWMFTILWCYCMTCCWFFADTVLVSIRDRFIESIS